jgi:hypothetical protein
MTNIIGNQPPPPSAQHMFAKLHQTHVGKPANYAEAQGDPARQQQWSKRSSP